LAQESNRRLSKRSDSRCLEVDVYKPIRKYLDWALPSNCVHFHVPNGAKLGARQIWEMLAIGMKAGIPDHCIVFEGKAYFLEVKTLKGRVSEAQAQMHEQLRSAGSKVEVVRSVEEVERALLEWKFPLRSRLLPLPW